MVRGAQPVKNKTPEAHREALNAARKRLRSAETDMKIAHHDWERAFERLCDTRRQVELLEKFGPRHSRTAK